MPLSIPQKPKIKWTDRISNATEIVGRLEVFTLLLVFLLLWAGHIIAYFSFIVIVFYFLERWEIIKWLKEKYGTDK